MRQKNVPMVIIALLGILLVSSLVFCGCSLSNYSLNRDKAMDAKWGDLLQFKVDSDWQVFESGSDSDYSYLMSFSNDSDDLYLSIDLHNTNSSAYKYNDERTYGGWLDFTEEFFSRSAADMADEYVRIYKDSDDYDDSLASPDHYPSFVDCSVVELNPESADGQEFKIYQVKYKAVYTEAALENLKPEHPDLQAEYDNEECCALVKDGEHDLEITASNEGLLRDFLKTLDIDW